VKQKKDGEEQKGPSKKRVISHAEKCSWYLTDQVKKKCNIAMEAAKPRIEASSAKFKGGHSTYNDLLSKLNTILSVPNTETKDGK
jgi:hypothetical protein